MRLTLKAKLGATFAVVVLLSAASMFIALQALGSLNESFSAAMDGNVQRIMIADDLSALTLEVARDEKNIILTVLTAETPRVRENDRIRIEPVNDDFKIVYISYGFMESPNIPKGLGLCRKLGLKFDIMATSFFLGRRSIVPSAQSGMPLWQDKIFIFLMKNAANPTDFYKSPPGRVVELGTQVTV